jgi:FkbM family methyltransferase
VAFEPGYASFARLCDNLALNRCQGTVIPIPLPLWSCTSIMGLKYRDVTPGQSRHQLMPRTPPSAARSRESRYEQPVLGIMLDDLVRLYHLPPPTAVKLDVDGAETHVLQGAIDTLRGEDLRSVLVEFSEETGKDVRAVLRKAGFLEASVVARDKPNAPIYAEFRRDRE